MEFSGLQGDVYGPGWGFHGRKTASADVPRPAMDVVLQGMIFTNAPIARQKLCGSFSID